MRLHRTSVLLLASLIHNSVSLPDVDTADAIFSIQTAASAEELLPTINTIKVTHPSFLPLSHSTPEPPLSSSSSSSSLSEHVNNLELRQAVGAAGGTVAAAPSATQMSPITTYLVHGPDGVETPMPYTQTFAKVPDQWPAPSSGTIGLGTIQGTVGAVKTNSKRGWVLPTEVVMKKGGGLGVDRDDGGRNVGGISGSGHVSQAGGKEVSILGVVGAVVMALVMGML